MFYKPNADMQSVVNICKRIDHKKIKFAVPWFKSYDCDFGTVCSDFKPSDWQTALCKEWKDLGGFEGWFSFWVEQWLSYQKIDKNIYFVLNGDISIRYGVPMLDYIYGNMIDKNILKANEKVYYKRHKVSDKYPIGYELIHEKIKGVNIN
jgi:hypothetical protein